MQIIGNVFNIILFLSVIGGAFSILSLLANRLLRFSLPLWFSICGMAAYIIPLLAPDLYLIPLEEQTWRNIYYILCAIWLCGTILLFLYDTIRTILAHRAIRNYRVCDDGRITAICTHCCRLAGLKKVPLIEHVSRFAQMIPEEHRYTSSEKDVIDGFLRRIYVAKNRRTLY